MYSVHTRLRVYDALKINTLISNYAENAHAENKHADNCRAQCELPHSAIK